MTGALTVATWNTEWRMPGSADAELICARLRQVSADIICLTEAYTDLLSGEGHLIASEPDYGYPMVDGRRKVLLWSRNPWEAVDPIGHANLPPGRFVAGRTLTPAGSVNIIGVCIPWRAAHVDSGRRDRQPWEDHLTYLTALGTILPGSPECTLLVGDFNQRVPRRYTPPYVHQALHDALGDRFRIATAGPIAPLDTLAIDHVAHDPALKPHRITALSNIAPDGRLLSDHFGVEVRLGCESEECR